MTVFIRILFCLTLFVSLLTCSSQNGNSEDSKIENCKYGAPTPVFSKDLGKVKDHSFSVKGQKGVEKVKFENGVELELLQDGCNEILQSYQFTLNHDSKEDDQFWLAQAVEQFRYLSTLSEDHLSLSLWAGAIANASEHISLGESFEPEPNTFIKIDKIPSNEKTILVVTFVGKG